MKPRFSFSSKRTGHTENIKKQRQKYPVLAEKIIQMSDIILEVMDARFIKETRNPELEETIKKQDKKLIYVFNKSDLANIRETEEINSLNPKVFVSCPAKRGIKELRNKIKITAHRIPKKEERITVGVIGYPNTGKSSVINLLAGNPSAGVGADAGFTKSIQKVRLTSEIVLLDCPGVIPKKEYSDSDAYAISKHAKVGARSYSQVKYPDIAVNTIMKEFPEIIEEYYGIKANGNSDELIEKLGRKKGFLKRGNQVNEDKTARLILKDWQEGRIRKT